MAKAIICALKIADEDEVGVGIVDLYFYYNDAPSAFLGALDDALRAYIDAEADAADIPLDERDDIDNYYGELLTDEYNGVLPYLQERGITEVPGEDFASFCVDWYDRVERTAPTTAP